MIHYHGGPITPDTCALKAWLGKFDHGCLPPNMSRAERIGEQCLMALGCCRVEVMRPGEGVFAQITYEKDIAA